MRVALTGGPAGGKTTLMQELRAADPGTSQWLLVPEAAPLLFGAGVVASSRRFQEAIVSLQRTLEDACAALAQNSQGTLCHRGTLDALAYWLHSGWEAREFFDSTRMDLQSHLSRYDGVIHLQTAAIGAEQHYRRWPDAHRPETIEQAAEIDRYCARAWSHHPRYVMIDNNGRDWSAKSRDARGLLNAWRTGSLD